MKVYHEEFLRTLMHQATNDSDRFKPVPHKMIRPGDVVLLEEKFSKRYMYPLAKVISIETNDLGEVTAARLFKGGTRETVYRHASSLIPLLSLADKYDPPDISDKSSPISENQIGKDRPKRRSGVIARQRLRTLMNEENN